MSKQKYIALIDCDSFFASCERVVNPELNSMPIGVVSGERGCVIARSREAKMLGVPMGVPLFKAVEAFPQCIYINANHYNYSLISQNVMKILKEISPNVEIYSIDEAFVDLTGLVKLYKMNYYKLAQYIQKTVYEKTKIPVSIGISTTKTLAKLASDKAKNCSNHVCLIGNSKRKFILRNTGIQEVWGVGRKLGVKLHGLGVRSALDYTNKDDEWIKKRFGKNGLAIKAELLGFMTSEISNEIELPKSISDSKSFLEFSSNLQFLKNELSIHIHDCCTRLRKINAKCKTIGVMLKRKDFITLYEKIDLDSPTDFEFEISRQAFVLLTKMYEHGVLYRSVGVVYENFSDNKNEQLSLFTNDLKKENKEKLGKSLDKLEKKFGRNVVRTGFVGDKIPFKQGFLTSPKSID